VEDELDGVAADGLDADDLDVLLAGHRLAVARPMAPHLGGGARHAQVFGRERELASVLEGDEELAAVLRQADLARPVDAFHGSGAPTRGTVIGFHARCADPGLMPWR